MSSFDVVVVGASLSGFRTVEALRRTGFAGRIALVGEENHLPYDRPPLSKKVLTGEITPGEISFVDQEGIAELDLDLFLGCAAVGVDTGTSTVILDSGDVLHYQELVIATGSRARQPFETLPRNVFVLRTLDDSLALREALLAAKRLVIVGGGFIGFEVASSARNMGVEVVVIEAGSAPLSRSIGSETAKMIADNAIAHGVDLICNRTVARFNGPDAVTGVTLDDGIEIDGDVVLLGIGSLPNSEWLAGSHLALERGAVLCDEGGLALGTHNVWAVGDVSAWSNSAGVHERHEHWTSAGDQARHVAKNIANEVRSAYTASSFVWSDQFGKRISIVGSTTEFDDIVFAGESPSADGLAALYLLDSIVVGACIIDQPRLLLQCRRWVAETRPYNEVSASFLSSLVAVAS